MPEELEDIAFYRKMQDGTAVASANLPALLGRPRLTTDETWRLPGGVRGWVMATAQQLDEIPDNAKVYAIARLKLDASRRHGLRWQFTIPREGGERFTFEWTRVGEAWPPYAYLVGSLATALFALPWIVRVGQDEGSPRVRFSLRRWSFLAAKVILLVTIAFVGIMDLCSGRIVEVRPQALVISFVVAFRWALKDQRRRCPICLGRLTNPVRFGGPSQMFLDWYGTELVCAEGHGMMHVPEIPSSSYAAQRWVSLDA
jgi:hypothetical protein